ncbi:hypothetical protein HPP92_015225 [Vanilla planifolia]|uniref:Uncharacterized protein n=1 Tax=Vanilla planifolia TaxID=51239 RepID=A0A835QKS4_VANPL|nr:hypothetical protein HPP92_015225 [Vanilla planifolia]
MATWVEHQQQQNGSKDVDEEACMYAMQLSSMVVLPMTLRVAVELGILEQIQAGAQIRTLLPRIWRRGSATPTP